MSVVFFPVEILPTIFRYGYAMPFYNVSRAVRTILFRTRDQGLSPVSFPHGRVLMRATVGLNFGVLFAWIAVSLVTIPLFQTYVRRRQVAEWQRSRGARADVEEVDSDVDTTQG